MVERFGGDLEVRVVGSLKTIIIERLEKGEIFCSGKTAG